MYPIRFSELGVKFNNTVSKIFMNLLKNLAHMTYYAFSLRHEQHLPRFETIFKAIISHETLTLLTPGFFGLMKPRGHCAPLHKSWVDNAINLKIGTYNLWHVVKTSEKNFFENNNISRDDVIIKVVGWRKSCEK